VGDAALDVGAEPVDSAAEASSQPVDSGGTDAGDATVGGQGCDGLPLCDSFDSVGDQVGMPPSSSLWTLVGTAGCSGNGNPSATTIYPITIDNTQFHSKPNSVKIVGGDSCGPLMINTTAFSKLTTGEVYGRFYVQLSDTTVLVHHAVLMALGLLRDGGSGLNVMDVDSFLELAPEMQGGLQTTTLTWQTNDSDHLPNTDSVGAMSSTYFAASTFSCFEFHTSANTNAIEVWINGTKIAGLSSPPAPPSANGASMWTPPSPFAPTSLGFGWISFEPGPMTVWIDDIALASTRIGCQ